MTTTNGTGARQHPSLLECEVRRARRGLSRTAAIPSALLDVAERCASHAFLGRATGGTYVRLVRFVHALATSQFPEQRVLRALDWGTGKGHITLLLREHGFDVTSCDVAEAQPDSSFGQPTPLLTDAGVDVVPLLDPVELPFESGSFHVATSFGVLEHVLDDAGSLRELARILEPGGLLFITFLPARTSYVQRLAHLRGNHYHDRLYAKRSVERIARAAGFHVASIERAQLFPKNRAPHVGALEAIDRALCTTPLGLVATNFEVVLVNAGT